MIGGLFVGALFIAVTAVIYTYVLKNTSFFGDSSARTIFTEVILGLLFLFIISLAANYRALVFVQDHAKQLLNIFFKIIFYSIAAVPLIMAVVFYFGGNKIAAIFMVIVFFFLLVLVMIFSNIMGKRLDYGAEWLSISAALVLKEPGMLVLSVFQSIITGVTVITEFFSIFAWNAYANQNNVGHSTATLIFYIISFLYLWFSMTVVYFFDGANTFIAYSRFKGNDPKIGQGINAAMKRILQITIFAFLSTTVMFITNILKKGIRFGSSTTSVGGTTKNNVSTDDSMSTLILGVIYNIIKASYVGTAWFFQYLYHLISFFTLPIIVLRGKKISEAMNESAGLFGKNAWDWIMSDMGYNISQLVMYLITGIILAIFGFAYGYFVAGAGGANKTGWGFGIAILALIFGLLITKFFTRPLYTTFITAIYIFASEGPNGIKNISQRLHDELIAKSQAPKAKPRIAYLMH